MVSIKHAKVSIVSDSANTNLIQPSDWNDELVSLTSANTLIGRTTTGSGPFEEISVGDGLALANNTISVSLSYTALSDKPTLGTASTANTLGTVSQSSGVPTGSILETGSNSNGTYIRYADGTQICTASISWTFAFTSNAGYIFRSNHYTWTFPATFSAEPTSVHIMPKGSSTGLYGEAGGNYYTISASSVQVNMIGVISQSTPTYNIKLSAIGRWF